MRKSYLSQSIAALKGMCAMLMLMLVSTVTAQKAVAADLGEIELGKAYTLTAFESVTAQYTPTADGYLTITGSGTEIPTPYSDEAHTTGIDYTRLTNKDPYYQYYILEVKAGTPVYFAWGGLNSGSFTATFTEGLSVSLQSASVAEGSTIMCTQTTQLSYTFNSPVTFDVMQVQIGDDATNVKNLNAQESSASPNTIFASIKDTFYELMKDGTMKEGDAITIRIKNIHADGNDAVKYGTDGTYEIKYVCGPKPITLVSTQNIQDNTFLSYWLKGDKSAQLGLTFDGPVLSPTNYEGTYPTKFTLTYGSAGERGESSDQYVETIEGENIHVDGNTIYVDMSGVERTPLTMLGKTTPESGLVIKFNGVRDANGYPVYSASSGSIGSYTYTMNYEVMSVNASVEFTPANGGSLTDKESIELWMTDYAKFTFDGVKFIYTDANGSKQTLVSTDYTATADEDNEGAEIITIAIPEAVKGATNVIVSLTNLQAADGQDYTEKFTAKYDGFVVKSFTYTEDSESAPVSVKGGEFAAFKADAILAATTNMDDKIVMLMYDITDLNPNEGESPVITTWARLEKDEATGKITTEVPTNYKFYLGHTYRMDIAAYDVTFAKWNKRTVSLGTDTLTFKGTTEPYVFSSVKLESHTPADDTINSADNFNITLNYDGLVTLKSAYIDQGFSGQTQFASVTPTDPTEGENGDQYANTWTLNLSAAAAEALGAEEVRVLIEAYDMDGLLVEGNYGTEEASRYELTLTLDFAGADLTVSPESGTQVEKLYQFTIGNSKGIMFSYANQVSDLELRDNTGRATAYAADYDPVYPENYKKILDYIDGGKTQAEAEELYGAADVKAALDYTPKEIVVTLNKEVTTPGYYTLYIPKGYFNAGTQFESENGKEVNATYEIPTPAQADYTVVADPESGSTVTSLSTISLVFEGLDEIAMGSGMISVKLDGEEVKRLDAELDFDIYNKAVVSLGYQDTPGEYTIEVPEGYFTNSTGDALAGFTLTYTIKGSKPAGYAMTTDPVNGATVESLGTVSIVFDDLNEISIGSGMITVKKDGEQIKTLDAELDWDMYNKATIDLGTQTEKGLYTIEVPDGYFQDASGNAIPGFILTYGIGVDTGIQAIFHATNLSSATVYTISGRRVPTGTKLPAGLYIVNGKKVIVK